MAALVAAALLAAPPPVRPPTPADLAALVADLGDPRFAVRERASAVLWACGPAADPALKGAARSPNPEVARRAQDVLAWFDRGVLPGFPAAHAPQIALYRTGTPDQRAEALRLLCASGDPDGIATALRLVGREPDPAVRAAAAARLAGRLDKLAPALVAAGREDEFEALAAVGLVVGHPAVARDYAAWHHARGSAADAIAGLRRRPAPAGGEADALATLVLLSGDPAGAAALARKTAGTPLRLVTLFHAGDWATLARTEFGDPGPERPSYRAAFLELAGDRDGADRAVEAVVRSASGARPLDAAAAAKNLLLLGRPEKAARVLRAAGDHARLFELLAAQLEYADALAAPGRPARPGDRLYLDLDLAVLRAELGDRGGARKGLDGLAGSRAVAGQAVPFSLIRAEARAGFADAAFGRLLKVLPAAPAWGKPTPLASVYGPRADQADALWLAVRRARPDEPVATSLARLRRLMRDPAAEADFPAWAPAALEAFPPARPKDDELGWGDRELAGLGRVCERAGAVDLAGRCWETLAKARPSVESTVMLAEFHGRQGRWAEAAAQYADAARLNPADPVFLFLRGLALGKAGQAANRDEPCRRAVLLALSDTRARVRMARALAADGEADAADRAFAAVPPLAGLRGGAGDAAVEARAALAARRGDHLGAAEHLDRLRLYRLDRGQLLTPADHLGLAVRLRRHRALGLLAKGDVGAAIRDAEDALRLLPGDLDTPLAVVPALDKVGKSAEADALYQRAAAAHRRVLADFPGAAGHHAALARLAAGCNRDLDAGLTHGRRAAELTPDDPPAVAALAEVLFVRREVDEAVELARRCVDLDPADDAHRDRLVRFFGGHPVR